jgi:hypothetical protein
MDGGPVAATRKTFPEINARSLTGRGYRLPGDLDGDRNVLVVAFKRAQQELVDGWLPALLALESRVANLRVYEIPTISGAWSPARWLIDGGMRGGIPDPDARGRTLTSYTDVGRVLKALGLEGPETIAVVLIERSGEIVWQQHGPFDERKLSGLSAALE